MQTRFVAYDRLGSRRGVLPHVLEADFVPTKNELPTLTLTYPRRARQSKYLDNNPEVAFQYRHEGKWVEPLDARFRLQSTDFDHLEETETKVYTFIGVGEAIRGIYIFDDLGLPVTEEGAVQFGKRTTGDILSLIWESALDRGWKGLSRSFTSTHDSKGMRWNDLINVSLDVDNTLESVLMYFVRGGLVDFHWEGRTLHVYNNGTAYRDTTNSAQPLRFNLSGGPTGVDSAPELTDRESMATHVIVNGEDGLRWEFPTGAILPEGRREVFLSYSGVDEEATARILAQPTIVKYANALKNTTRQFRVAERVSVLPFIDYRIGDYSMVERADGEWERMQIYSVALTINDNGVQGYVGLGDKIDTLLEVLNEKVQRITGGSATESPGEVTPSTRKPSAPSSLMASTETYTDNWGLPKSSVTVSFVHDGKDEKGTIVKMDRFSVQFRRGDDGPWSELFNLEAPEQQATHSPLETYDSNGELQMYQFRVLAYASNGAISNPSAIVDMWTKSDTTIPDKPYRPDVRAQHAIFTVSTSHETAARLTPQSDYSHAIVEAATSPTASYWTNVGTILKSGRALTVTNMGYATIWFRLVAVDTSGNKSLPSNTTSATTQPLVETDYILNSLDGAKITDNSIVTRSLKVTEDMMVKLLSVYEIKANDIDVNDLTADFGFISSLKTNVLTADSITGTMIRGDAINGKTITGAVIRTAATGERTEMTREGIRALNEQGQELVRVGYGLTSGISVRDPYTNKMSPLQNHVFGSMKLSGQQTPKAWLALPDKDQTAASQLETFDHRVWSDKRVHSSGMVEKELPIYDSHNLKNGGGGYEPLRFTARAFSHVFLMYFTAVGNIYTGYTFETDKEPGTEMRLFFGVREANTTGTIRWEASSFSTYLAYTLFGQAQSKLTYFINLEEGKQYDLFVKLKIIDSRTKGAYVEVEGFDMYSIPYTL